METIRETSSGGKVHHLDEANVRSVTHKLLKAKRSEIDKAANDALKAFRHYKTLVIKEYARSDLAVPAAFGRADDAISSIDLGKSWAWHSAAILKKKGDHRARVRRLVSDSRLKHQRSIENPKHTGVRKQAPSFVANVNKWLETQKLPVPKESEGQPKPALGTFAVNEVRGGDIKRY